jgi:hypothetical protein
VGLLRFIQPTAKKIAPMTKNGSFGRPGTRPKTMIITPATSGALR